MTAPAVEPGPGLARVMARHRIRLAVLAILLGEQQMPADWSGSREAEAGWAELTEAAKALVAAQEQWDEAVARRRAAIPGSFGPGPWPDRGAGEDGS